MTSFRRWLSQWSDKRASQSETIDETNNAPDEVASMFYDGIFGSIEYKELSAIGIELYKVKLYADEKNTDSDRFSQAIVLLTLSTYYAGVVPLIRIHSALFAAQALRNEYAYALAVRAQIEIVGRIHKGLRLWRNFHSKNKQIEDLRQGRDLDAFHQGVVRLLAKYQPNDNSPSGIYSGKGFNILTFVKSLEDKQAHLVEIYDMLSSYVHGGFEEQEFLRESGWIVEMRDETNPIITSYSKNVGELWAIVFEDLNELLHVTAPLRERYENDHSLKSG